MEALEPRLMLSAGDLDPSFGTGGLVTTDIGGPADVSGYVSCAVTDAEGKVILAGTSEQAYRPTATVARHNSDGSLDTTFGEGGIAIIDMDVDQLDITDMALDASGRIILAGWARVLYGSHDEYFVARINTDGTPDTSFDGDGKVMTDVRQGAGDRAYTAAVQADGKIVVGGTSGLARYNEDGSLDTTFDGDGLTISGPRGYVYDLALLANGQIVTAGQMGVTRYNDDGSLDTSYDGDGWVDTDFLCRSVAIQPDGKALVGGPGVLARLNVDGSFDTTFDGDGKVVMGSSDRVHNIEGQADGRIVTLVPTTRAIVRYLGDGSLDTSFDGDGIVESQFHPWDLSIQTDGRILVSGSVYGTGAFHLARYNNDGSLDTGLGGDGEVSTVILSSGTSDRATSIVTVGDKIVVAGDSLQNYTGYDFTVARYHLDGTLDTTFGDDGIVVDAIGGNSGAWDLAAQPDDKIVVVGAYNLVRYNVDGSLDTAFDDDGIVDLYGLGVGASGNSVAIQADGKIIVAGGKVDVTLARFDSTGAIDSSFGSGGVVVTDLGDWESAESVTVLPDGKILIGGYSDRDGGYDFLLARYNPDGSLDTDFGTDGVVLTNPSGQATDMAVQADGMILLAGWTYASWNWRSAVGRYNADGSPDMDFGVGGIVVADWVGDRSAYAVTVQEDEKVLVAGPGGSGAFAVARYNADGSPDATFGVGGVVFTSIGESGSHANDMVLQSDGRILLAGRAWTDEGRQDFALARYFAVPAGETSEGADVVVEPIVDGGTQPTPVVLTFDSITADGETTVTTSPTTETPPPGGLRLAGGTVYYDLSTTATFDGEVELCFIYDEAEVAEESVLALYHYEDGAWVDVTTRLDTVNNRIYGVVTSFSPFAIFEAVQTVEIDIDPEVCNVNQNGVLPVTLFTTDEFDAASVDVATVRFADALASSSALEDVDGDGDLDMVLKFRVDDTSLRSLYEQLLAEDVDADGILDSTRQEAEVSLTGRTVQNDLFEGTDTVDLFLSGKALRELLDSLFEPAA